jgi:hypothetical protein
MVSVDDIKYGRHKNNNAFSLIENRVGLAGCDGSQFCGNDFVRQYTWLRAEADKYSSRSLFTPLLAG